jgi:hypothetical protein
MRSKRVFAGPLVTIACAFAGGILLFPSIGSGRIFGPVSPPSPESLARVSWLDVSG